MATLTAASGFLDSLQASLASPDPVRQKALARFLALGLPTPKQEAFKYSRLATLAERSLPVAPRLTDASGRLQDAVFPFQVAEAVRLVVVDGYLVPECSQLDALPPGVRLDLFERPEEEPETDNPFWALNTAGFGEGLGLTVEPGTHASVPLQVVWIGTQSQLVQPRMTIRLGRHSEITLIETFVGLTPHQGLTNAVHQVQLDDGAVLHRYKLVLEPKAATHVATLAVQQAAHSQLHAFYLALGGGLVRDEVRVLFGQSHAECHLHGLFVADGHSQMDNQTFVDHTKPHCTSHQLYRGILDDSANGVFNGRVMVRPDAQKTNAYQSNNNLLLGEGASIDTKPQLEIDADDVKCSHGATIGRLDEEALFYLRSRGIDPEMARSLLSVAFASQVVDRIPIASLRDELNQWLFDRFTKEQEA